MRKITLAAILILSMVILSACDAEVEAEIYVEHQEEVYDAEFEKEIEEQHNPNAIFLYDFDHMVQLMEDSFPFFGVAERRMGVDIHALAAETRRIIEGYPNTREELHEIVARNDAMLAEFWGLDDVYINDLLHALGLLRDLPYMDFLTFRSIVNTTFSGHCKDRILPMSMRLALTASILGNLFLAEIAPILVMPLF